MAVIQEGKKDKWLKKPLVLRILPMTNFGNFSICGGWRL
jgi:hypothetical protein